MSYSISAKAGTKELAKAAVALKFDEIVSSQPIHARDRAAILANAGAAIDLLADDDTKDIAVSCNGSVIWNGVGEWTPETAPLNQVSINCTVSHSTRAEAVV